MLQFAAWRQAPDIHPRLLHRIFHDLDVLFGRLALDPPPLRVTTMVQEAVSNPSWIITSLSLLQVLF